MTYQPSEVPRSLEDRVSAIASPSPSVEMVALSTRIPKDLRRRLRMDALRLDESVQDLVTIAIERELDRRGRPTQ